MRSAIEGQCALIATGEATKSAVVAASLDLFRRKFLWFVQSIALMDELFEATFSAAESKGIALSQCGKCDRFMTYYGADAPPPQRLVCTTCDEVHRLPPGGIVRQWSGHRCPLDNFELVLFDLGSASKTLGNTCVLLCFSLATRVARVICITFSFSLFSFLFALARTASLTHATESTYTHHRRTCRYPLCPLCYNAPPDVEDAPSSAMSCNRCPITTCPHAAPRWTVCPCPGGGGAVDTRPGEFVLFPVTFCANPGHNLLTRSP